LHVHHQIDFKVPAFTCHRCTSRAISRAASVQVMNTARAPLRAFQQRQQPRAARASNLAHHIVSRATRAALRASRKGIRLAPFSGDGERAFRPSPLNCAAGWSFKSSSISSRCGR
jgi:hypothetical protein